MKEIPLTRDKVAIVDDEDFEMLSNYKWRTKVSANTFYALTSDPLNNKKNIFMHRMIMSLTDVDYRQKQVDHKNGNGLDNRKRNLRICTFVENARNRTSATKNISGYKGVVRKNSKKKFYAEIGIKQSVKGKKKSIHWCF